MKRRGTSTRPASPTTTPVPDHSRSRYPVEVYWSVRKPLIRTLLLWVVDFTYVATWLGFATWRSASTSSLG